MTSIINKEKFVADCILDYRTGDEYDLTLVYDQFFTSSNIDEYESDAETGDENS
jgi:hypothetical protein